MNFFEQQDRARQKTGLLVVFFLLAVAALVLASCVLVAGLFAYIDPEVASTSSHNTTQSWWAGFLLRVSSMPADTYLAIAVVIVSVVGLASLLRLLQLSAGGAAVAEALGGRLINTATRDVDERRLLNIVEEMAIASGVPVPAVYVLEEPGINAFAAGTRPQNAVVGVTRGAVRELDREELQGVVAHEFSHIFNGDMRLNMRLTGVLYGILVIGYVGYYLLRITSRGGLRSKSNNGALPFLALGAGLMVIGYAGTFFGNLIKSAVSRQREFLADASAVQYTRDPQGIAGALKKIGGFASGSRIAHPGSAEMSHLFFGQAISFLFNGLFATHPPLDERIRRIDQSWRVLAEDSGQNDLSASQPKHDRMTVGFAGVAHGDAVNNRHNQPGQVTAIAADQLSVEMREYTGSPNSRQLQQARQLIGGLSERVVDAAHEPYGARALVYVLLLSMDDSIRSRQLTLLAQQADSVVYGMVLNLQQDLENCQELSLAVLDLSLPALSQLSSNQAELFDRVVTGLIQADDHMDLYEWSLYVLVRGRLHQHRELPRLSTLPNLKMFGKSIQIVLSGLAYAAEPRGSKLHGDDLQRARASFSAAVEVLGMPHLSCLPAERVSVEAFEAALRQLRRLQPLQKPRLLKALVQAAANDGMVRPFESQLIRAIAQSLDCPAPLFAT